MARTSTTRCLRAAGSALALGALLAGCSMHKMTGDTMVSFTTEEAVPFLMASDDVGAGCEMGVSMGGFLMSFSRVGVDTAKAAIPSLLSAGMCAEDTAWEAELRRQRALGEGRAAEARDAGYAEKHAHHVASQRNYGAFLQTIAAYGSPDDGCPEFDGVYDEAIFMLGMSAGALAVQHDRLADGAVGVPMDVPRTVERGAACLDVDRWFGMPAALRAAIWLSIPGVTPEGTDPWATLEAAAKTGDAQGVAMARALLIQTARANGQAERMCAAVDELSRQLQRSDARSAKWALLDTYAALTVRHEVDVTWTKALGHRSPPDTLACYAAPVEEDGGGDDLLDDLGGDDADAPPAPVATPEEAAPVAAPVDEAPTP